MSTTRPSLKSANRLSLGWTYLNEVTSGKSAIDLGALGLRDIDDARQFARAYGFDIDDPHEIELIRRAHREAVQFITSTFLPPHQVDLIPREVSDPADVLQLLVFASRHVLHADSRRLWSCAVLKVMHGVFYIDNNLRLKHFASIRRQVFEGLDHVLHFDGQRHYLSDGEICLPLQVCEKKSNKGRHSILLKLLQKAAYVAADISDHLGLRLVFNTRFECLLALRVLQRAQLLSVINIEPQRTRNNLLDVLLAREIYAQYRDQIEAAEDYPDELLKRMDDELIARSDAASRADNPHSASGYQSLQVTLRKMIRCEQTEPGQAPTKFFFEYEIQMMDLASYEKTREGPASHQAYKRRQIETARKRVLGKELLDWLRRESAPVDSEFETEAESETAAHSSRQP